MEIRDYNEIELQNIKDSYHVNAILNNRDIEKLLDACDDYRYKNDKLDNALGMINENLISEDKIRDTFNKILEQLKGKMDCDLEYDILELYANVLDLNNNCSMYIDIVEGRN